MSRGTHFIITVSLGLGIEPTAIAVTEQRVVKGDSRAAETEALHLRHLERLPAATFDDIVAKVSTLLESDEIKDGEKCGGAEVVLDITFTGRKAVVEMFEAHQIAPITVTISGGVTREEKIAFNDWQVSKVELVSGVRAVFETTPKRLIMAEGLPLVPALMDEFRSFKMRQPRIDASDPESWREVQLSDLVRAVALAPWRASHHVPLPDYARRETNRLIDEYYKKMAGAIV